MQRIIQGYSFILIALLISSCQNPNLLRREIVKFPADYYTESINYERQNFISLEMPDSLEVEREISLKGLSNHSLLKIYDHLVLTTRNGFLHLLSPGDFKTNQKTKISQAISASPTYYGKLIFIASELGKSGLVAYDIFRGAASWTKKGLLSSSSPIVSNNMVFHASLNGTVTAMNIFSGETIWQESLNDKISASMAYSDGYLAAVSNNGTLKTFDSSSGSELWSLDIGEAVYTHPVIKNGRIYILTYSGTLLILHLKRGTIISELGYDTPFYQSLSIDDNHIYIPFSDGTLKCLDIETLKEKWSNKLQGPFSTGILVSKNNLYGGTTRKHYYVIDKNDGTVLQNFLLKGRPRTIPLFINGQLYIAFEKKHIAILSSL